MGYGHHYWRWFRRWNCDCHRQRWIDHHPRHGGITNGHCFIHDRIHLENADYSNVGPDPVYHRGK